MPAVSRSVAFRAEREQTIVHVLDPSEHRHEWSAYVDGLQACYAEMGVGHIVDDHVLDQQSCSMLWLVESAEGDIVGGVRAVGPIRASQDVDRLPIVDELSSNETHQVLCSSLADLAPAGLVEAKGAWSAPGTAGLGRLLARFPWHCMRWFGVEHVVASAGSAAVLRLWRSTGAEQVDGVAPTRGFPNADYVTEPVIWSHARLATSSTSRTASVRRLVDDEWAYVHPMRPTNDHDASAGHEIIVDPAQQDGLVDAGLELTDVSRWTDRSFGADQGAPHDDPRSMPVVHFPWRNRAIRVPGPRAFRDVRSERNQYKLTPDDMERLRTKKVGVIGLSVGASIAYTMAQESLCGELRLADHDEIELSNLNRLPASLLDLGQNKADVLARRLAELDPYLDVRIYREGLSETSMGDFLRGLDLVIEECDSFDMKVAVRLAAAEMGIPVIMETTDRGLLDVERFDLEPGRPPFHGLLGDVDPRKLDDLDMDDKVELSLQILGPAEISPELGASLVEIGSTISSWPQLASDVTLGSALATTAAREVLLGRSNESGRTRVDLKTLLRPATPEPPAALGAGSGTNERPPLSTEFEPAIREAARLAPSGGNMQPWRFSLTRDSFEIRSGVDPLVGLDVKGRGTAVACGAALFNATCVAAAHNRLGSGGRGWDLAIDLDDPDLLVRLDLGNGGDPELAAYVPLIPLRLTNRQLDPSGIPLSGGDLRTLRSAAEAEGAEVAFAPAGDLGDLVASWAASDRARLLNDRLHREMFAEVRWPGLDPLETGLDVRTLELSSTDQVLLPLLGRSEVMGHLRSIGGGERLGDDVVKRLEQSAGLLVVHTAGGERADYVRGGAALQRLWLEATRLGLGLQPVSPVFGYAQDESELVAMLGEDVAGAMQVAKRQTNDALGLSDDDQYIMALRVHHGPPPTAISARLAPSEMTGLADALAGS